jgi:hypothetical protein
VARPLPCEARMRQRFLPGRHLLFLLAFLGNACAAPAVRRFPDRPVAWQEHDDTPLAKTPSRSHPSADRVASALEELVLSPIDRTLRLERKHSAEDVNAMDEVPCSTWFCPRNHLKAVTEVDLILSPPRAPAPVAPFTIIEGKSAGRAPGFLVEDATGRRYLIKLDPAGHAALASGAEIVGSRLFWAAGYNVPGAFAITIDPGKLQLAGGATWKPHGYHKAPLDAETVKTLLAAAAHDDQGRLGGVAVPWIDGEILGPFSMTGTRDGDPNDRIRHERRRSLRASLILFAWLNIEDAGSQNTLDSIVENGTRRHVRHWFIDFGDGLGSATVDVKPPHKGAERLFDPGRTIAALFSLGLWHRNWQGERDEWAREVAAHPSTGWFPGQGWVPSDFRTGRYLSPHAAMTDRDAYWGAKVVTSFSNAQIEAALHGSGYKPADAERIARALEARRDAIGREFLTRVTAVENPRISGNGRTLCFRDLVIERGAARPGDVVYQVETREASGKVLFARRWRGRSARVCFDVISAGHESLNGGSDYRIVTVTAELAGRRAKASRVHAVRRPKENRFVVVGLERDE